MQRGVNREKFSFQTHGQTDGQTEGQIDKVYLLSDKVSFLYKILYNSSLEKQANQN